MVLSHAGTCTVELEGGIEAPTTACWGGGIGVCPQSFSAPSVSDVDATKVFEGSTSISGLCVAGG